MAHLTEMHESVATALRLVEPPAQEPVSLDEVLEHSRIDGTGEAGWVLDRIRSWRQQTERATSRALVTQTWELTLCRFPAGPIRLHRPPVQSIESVEYVDAAGSAQALDVGTDVLLVKDDPARLYPAPGTRWPSVQADHPEAVKVTFVAGYGGPQDVPQALRDAILLGVATKHEHREDVVVGTIVAQFGAIEALWNQHRWDTGLR